MSSCRHAPSKCELFRDAATVKNEHYQDAPKVKNEQFQHNFFYSQVRSSGGSISSSLGGAAFSSSCRLVLFSSLFGVALLLWVVLRSHTSLSWCCSPSFVVLPSPPSCSVVLPFLGGGWKVKEIEKSKTPCLWSLVLGLFHLPLLVSCVLLLALALSWSLTYATVTTFWVVLLCPYGTSQLVCGRPSTSGSGGGRAEAVEPHPKEAPVIPWGERVSWGVRTRVEQFQERWCVARMPERDFICASHVASVRDAT